jgi:hypothetical protein
MTMETIHALSQITIEAGLYVLLVVELSKLIKNSLKR